MPESHDRTENRPPETGKKAYAPPKLTEYGSVAKLTMSKGSTRFEGPGTKKSCL